MTEFVSTAFSPLRPNLDLYKNYHITFCLFKMQYIMLLIPLFQLKAKQRKCHLQKCCLAVLAEKKGKHQLPLPVGEIVRNVGKVP